MSRLHMSSKSLPGVREDMDIPDGPGDDVRWEGTSIHLELGAVVVGWPQ